MLYSIRQNYVRLCKIIILALSKLDVKKVGKEKLEVYWARTVTVKFWH